MDTRNITIDIKRIETRAYKKGYEKGKKDARLEIIKEEQNRIKKLWKHQKK